MGHGRGAGEVHAQHAIPIGGVDIPKREAELPRADADAVDDVPDRPDAFGASADRVEIEDIGDIPHRAESSRGREDFLPKLQQELIAVVARYVAVDPDKVVVNLDRGSGMSTLAIGIELPGNGTSGRNAAA